MGKSNSINPGGTLYALLQSKSAESSSLEPWQLKSLKPDALYRVFLAETIPYKGALVSAFAKRGTSGSVKVEFDIGPPAINASVNAKIGGERSDYILMILTRFPQKCDDFKLSRPWALSCMTGYLTSASVGIGGELGFKASLPGIAREEEDKSTSFKSEDAWEAASTTCEAKAVIGVEASYAGNRLLLRDSSPACYKNSNDNQLISEFNALLGGCSIPALKQNVLRLWDYPALPINIRELKPKQGFFRSFFGFSFMESFSELKSKLTELQTSIENIEPTTRAEVDSSIEFYRKLIETSQIFDAKSIAEARKNKKLQLLLERGQSDDTSLHKGFASVATRLCFLDLWGHNPSAGLTAKAEAALKIANSGATASVSVGVQAGYKYTLYRYQNFISDFSRNRTAAERFSDVVASAARSQASILKSGQLGKVAINLGGQSDQRNMLLMTQDTSIRYSTVGIKTEAETSFNLPTASHDILDPFPPKVKEKREEIAKKLSPTYSSMRYEAAIVYWKVPYSSSIRTEMPALKGSGYVYGCSYPIGKLLRASDSLQADFQSYAKIIATDLHITPSAVQEFLLECHNKIADITRGGQYPALLIEAAFAVPDNYAFPVEQTNHENYYWYQPKTTKASLGGFKEHMKKAVNGKLSDVPDVLRLRLRKADELNNTKTKFRLGFKFIGGVEIELNSVEEAGHETIIDLHVKPFNKESFAATQEALQESMMNRAANSVTKYREHGGKSLGRFKAVGTAMIREVKGFISNSEELVPPVALLHQ